MLDRAQPSSPLHRSQRSPPLSSFASHCPQPKISFSSTAFFFSFLQRKLMGQCIISMVKTTERTELWKQMFKQTEDRKCMREKKKNPVWAHAAAWTIRGGSAQQVDWVLMTAQQPVAQRLSIHILRDILTISGKRVKQLKTHIPQVICQIFLTRYGHAHNTSPLIVV